TPLTAHRNLSALVTCHTLYVVFTTWQSAVFLVNSRLTHFTATRCILATHSFFSISRDCQFAGGLFACGELAIWRNHQNAAGTPSSEVTGLDCRVPYRGFTHAPWHNYAHPPVSDSGTGNHGNPRKFFSVPALMDPLQPKPPRPCPCGQTATFNRRPISTQTSLPSLTTAGAGILNLLSIVYAFGLDLGPD